MQNGGFGPSFSLFWVVLLMQCEDVKIAAIYITAQGYCEHKFNDLLNAIKPNLWVFIFY